MARCSACSAEIPAGSRFCGSCGEPSDRAEGTATETSFGKTAATSVSSDSLDNARFLPGTLLAERYRIVGMLGRGGMGEVYRADDLRLGQPVALKFLPEAMGQDAARRSRLLSEVRMARQVSHPNVCRVYDVGELDGAQFISMEYVDGEDLASLLRRIGRLPREKALELARQICAGVAAAHEQGILHRDLKPANVMIDGRGRVKLTDFGLAGLAEGIDKSEIRSGTPAYMAPEQIAGREVTVRSDIYALGLVLYELFTGKAAFSGKNVADIARQQQESAPTSPASLVDDMDDTVALVILRCLEKEPRERPLSALSVAAALPGGDPLAAALAAGETPSPQMVAEAGVAGGLKPAVAVACLAGLLVSLVLATLLLPGQSLHGMIPLELSPADLAARAEGLLDELLADDLPAYRRWGFDPDFGYLNWVAKEDDSPSRWERLADGRPPGARFWFRYSDELIEPQSIHANSVSSSDPPLHRPGSGIVQLDTEGRLERLELFPPERLQPGAPAEPFDWSILFRKSSLDVNLFAETEPVRAPRVPCDVLRAWRGQAYGEGIDTVVQAGTFAGRATYFEILGPWDLEDETGPASGSGANFAFGLVMALILLGAVLLARRNLKAGRSDRKGAFRLALFFVAAMLATWFVGDVRLSTFDIGNVFGELVFGRAMGHALLHAMVAWLLYVAIEPYVRRLWPESLVSWNRVLLGRVRDPLVGRDILVGLALFLTWLVVGAWVGERIMTWTGTAPGVPVVGDITFISLRDGLAGIAGGAQASVGFPMVFLVLLLLLRLLLRRTWLAVAALIVLFGLSGLANPAAESSAVAAIWAVVSAALFACLMLTCMLRLGLLSVMSGMFVIGGLSTLSLTADPSDWYAGTTLLILSVMAALGAWAFYVSLAGRKLFKDSLLDGA